MSISLNELLSMTPQLLLVIGGLGVLISQILIRGKGGARVAWNLTLITLVTTATVVIFGLSDSTGSVTVLPRAFLGADTVSAMNNTFRYSSFSANGILLLVALAILALLFLRTLLPALDIDFAENYFLLLMSLAGYAYAICAEDMITLFVGLELGSLPVLVLIGMNRDSRASNEAALKYLLLSAFAMAFLLLGLALLYAGTGTVKLRELREIAPHFTKTRIIVLAQIFILAGFFFKLAAFPLHGYIADVYEGCTTAFTAVLASVSKAAAALILFKVSMAMHDGFRPYLAPILTFAAIGSMFIGTFASLATPNLKRILGYSSVTNAGFILCFLIVPASVDAGMMGTVKQDAGSALFIYVIGYATASLLAFAVIAFIEQRMAKATLNLADLEGLVQRDRFAAWALGLCVLSFMGMPPLAGFFGKYFLFKSLALSGNLTIAAVAGLASGISVYAYLRILKPIFFGAPDASEPNKSSLSSPSAQIGVGVALATLTFFAVFSAFVYNSGVTAVQKIY